jgi:hypothetical protein
VGPGRSRPGRERNQVGPGAFRDKGRLNPPEKQRRNAQFFHDGALFSVKSIKAGIGYQHDGPAAPKDRGKNGKAAKHGEKRPDKAPRKQNLYFFRYIHHDFRLTR